MRKRGAEDQLTDPENSDFLGTYTSETWRGLAVEEVCADWYSLDFNPRLLAEIGSPLKLLVNKARRTSGNIDGKHREDLRDAIIGSPAQSVGFSVPGGNADREETAEPARRGI